MSNLQDNFTDNDYNMYNYLNQKIIQKISNDILIKNINSSDFTINNVRDALKINMATGSDKNFESVARNFFENDNTDPSTVDLNFYGVTTNKVTPVTTPVPPSTMYTQVTPKLDTNYRHQINQQTGGEETKKR